MPASTTTLQIPSDSSTPAAKARLRRVYGYLRTPSVVPTSARRQMFQFTASEALARARQHIRIMDGCPPVSFDITAMDGGHDQRSAFASWRA